MHGEVACVHVWPYLFYCLLSFACGLFEHMFVRVWVSARVCANREDFCQCMAWHLRVFL